MIKVVSLFSGGGGLDLGFKSEGYDIIWAIDNNANAVATYKRNISNHILCADINTVDINSIPHADVIIGGPPCQAFSLAGNRNTADSRGMLVWRYFEILSAVKPRAFVFENVTGLLSAKNKNGEKVIDNLAKAFSQIGYTVTQSVINAADYGVPQKRRRVILVGLRGNTQFTFPARTHSEEGETLPKYISVLEALSDLPNASKTDEELSYDQNPTNEYQKLMRKKAIAVTEHTIPSMSSLDRYIISYVKPGGNYMDIPTDVNSKRIRRLQQTGGHTTCYGRMLPNQPAYTINTYFNRPNVGCNIHYKEDRLITVREALRLQSFPDDYELVSSSKQGKALIVGNAVPPLLAKAIAHELKSYIN